MTDQTNLLATISFQPEAYDTAANLYRQLEGLTVTVVVNPHDNLPLPDDHPARFDAEFSALIVGGDGQYKALLAPWDDELDGPGLPHIELDIYDDILRLEVI